MSQRLIEHAREVRRFAPVRPAVKAGIRAAIAIFVPVLLASAFQLSGGLWLSLAANLLEAVERGGFVSSGRRGGLHPGERRVRHGLRDKSSLHALQRLARGGQAARVPARPPRRARQLVPRRAAWPRGRRVDRQRDPERRSFSERVQLPPGVERRAQQAGPALAFGVGRGGERH